MAAPSSGLSPRGHSRELPWGAATSGVCSAQGLKQGASITDCSNAPFTRRCQRSSQSCVLELTESSPPAYRRSTFRLLKGLSFLKSENFRLGSRAIALNGSESARDSLFDMSRAEPWLPYEPSHSAWAYASRSPERFKYLDAFGISKTWDY